MTEKNKITDEQDEKIIQSDETEDNNVEEVEEIEVIDEDEEHTEESTTVDETTDDKLKELEKEKEDLFNRHLRLQAEYDNFRKRTQKEKAADLTYKSQALVTELLPVLDDFERALLTASEDEAELNFVDGMKIIYRQLTAVLEKEGVEIIPTVGEEFDPNIHQAVATVSDDQYETNVVVEELQKGYLLKDRVIRPAMVKVNQ